jgi:hypothetical protein
LEAALIIIEIAFFSDNYGVYFHYLGSYLLI